jgi:hypothetical protein
MRPQKQFPHENLKRALKALHAVADLWLPDDGKRPDSETAHEEYLTVRQAAERIQYREQTIRNMMSTGVFKRGLHYYKRRGRVLFVWSRIERWLQEDAAPSDNSNAVDPARDNDAASDGNEPFYPVHHARTRKKRQTLL